MPRRRRLHGPRHVGAHNHAASNLRHVVERDLHRILQRLADHVGHIGANGRMRGHQLVGQHARLADRLLVGQTVGDQARISPVLEHAVARKSIEVHAQHLPAGRLGDRLPMLRCQRLRRQQLERHIRHRPRCIPLERLEGADSLRHQCHVKRLADQVGVERLPLGRNRLRVHHADHVGERRRLSDGGAH